MNQATLKKVRIFIDNKIALILPPYRTGWVANANVGFPDKGKGRVRALISRR